MKKIAGILLSMVLVMGVVFFTGGMEANGEQISNAWYGQWSCSSKNETYPNYNFVRRDTIRHLTISRDGTITGTDWMLYQVDGDWVGGATYDAGGEVTDETYPTFGHSWSTTIDGVLYTGSGRCIGSKYDQRTNVFMEATCINATVIDGLTDYIETFQCSRTIKPQ